MDELERQKQYTDGFAAGYAQAIGDADNVLQQHGDSRLIRYCRRDVLALVNVSYRVDDLAPQPDWTRYNVPGVP